MRRRYEVDPTLKLLEPLRRRQREHPADERPVDAVLIECGSLLRFLRCIRGLGHATKIPFAPSASNGRFAADAGGTCSGAEILKRPVAKNLRSRVALEVATLLHVVRSSSFTTLVTARRNALILGAFCVAVGALAAPPARAASLEQVPDFGQAGLNLPGDVSMYVYVPDDVAEDPPILTLIHYCGGTAQATFGQAAGGGLVQAADEHGFIIVAPSSGRCWDVVSDKTRARDGGGDSHAIQQMVRFALDAYDANPERVYATGASSGGMMTELLLALYPELFKGGSAFAGMPAGCRGDNESGANGGYSGACAGGAVSRSPQQWGDVARSLSPGYAGHRPRVQLFHGDDDQIITYPNHTEAIKQWVDVLGLALEPTSTTTVTLGQHQATRQSWQNDCGYVVLDAFTSLGGDHGPSDALFPAQYVVPFLALDQPGDVDPEVARCDDGGAGAGGAGAAGAAGAGGTGGTGSTGGAAAAGAGGTGGASGGAGGNGVSSGGSGGSGASGGGSGVGGGGGTTSAGGSNTGVGGSGASGGSGATPGAASTQGRAPSTSDSGCAITPWAPKGATTPLWLSLGLLISGWNRRRRAGKACRAPSSRGATSARAASASVRSALAWWLGMDLRPRCHLDEIRNPRGGD